MTHGLVLWTWQITSRTWTTSSSGLAVTSLRWRRCLMSRCAGCWWGVAGGHRQGDTPAITRTHVRSPGSSVRCRHTSQFLLLGALPLTTPNPAGGGIGACLPTFHAAAADQARVACTPDTTWPVTGHPPDSSRDWMYAPVSMSHIGFFDTSSAIHSRSPS